LLSDPAQHGARILLVDDNAANLAFLESLLTYSGYEQVRKTNSPFEAIQIFTEWHPHMMLLDIHMPGMTGYEVMDNLRAKGLDEELTPILIFTADCTPETRRRALDAGAADFITKPGEATEILLRVRNFLRMRDMYERLNAQNHNLEDLVAERTLALEQAQEEMIERLARAVEYRDDETGGHAMRVGRLSASIAERLGFNSEDVRRLRLASFVHDIGKIGIPDAILLKAGRLDDNEYQTMREHTRIGSSLLGKGSSSLVRAAESVSISHHERWDGTGYPNGLAGEDIPIFGRIVSVADVYDALVSRRPYKEPMSHEGAVQEITKCAGSQFDPRVVEAFLSVADELLLSEAAA
jgi:putative two-component system response regulator